MVYGTGTQDPNALKAALQAPSKFWASMTKESTFSVIWDSGASYLILPDCSDFVGALDAPETPMQLQKIAKGLKVEGVGHVLWPMLDSAGQLRPIKVPALYVPISGA